MAFSDLFGDNSGGWLGALAGGVLGGIGGGSKPAGQTTTTNAPWDPQQPYLKDLYARAQQESQYGGQFTPDQTDAQRELGKFASGERYNPMLGVDNKYLQGVIDNSSQDAMRNLMPMMAKANAASGSFGNSGVAETYGRSAADTLGSIATSTRYKDYLAQQGLNESDLDRRMRAIGGFQGQANAEQQLPWNNLTNYKNSINFGGNSTSQPNFTNPAANVLGGALGGYQLGSNWGK